MLKSLSAALLVTTAIVSVAACAVPAQEGEAAGSGESAIVATDRAETSAGVATSVKFQSGDLRAVFWDPSETTARAELNFESKSGNWSIVQLPERKVLQQGHRTDPTTPRWANEWVMIAWRTANAPEKTTGMAEQDSPGCDNIGKSNGGFLDDSCGSRARGCCNTHDNCYAQYGCTAASWFYLWGNCVGCNNAVQGCFITGWGQSNCRAGNCSCGGTGSCFVAGTPITMADGTTKSIEEVREGDVVKSFDETTGRLEDHKVVTLFKHDESSDNLVVVNGGLVTTANHPFYSNGRWIRADHLSVGDTLKTVSTAGTVASMSVSQLEGRSLPSVPVYNFEVEGTHTYFAGGVLVHNRKAMAESCDNTAGLNGADLTASDNGCVSGVPPLAVE